MPSCYDEGNITYLGGDSYGRKHRPEDPLFAGTGGIDPGGCSRGNGCQPSGSEQVGGQPLPSQRGKPDPFGPFAECGSGGTHRRSGAGRDRGGGRRGGSAEDAGEAVALDPGDRAAVGLGGDGWNPTGGVFLSDNQYPESAAIKHLRGCSAGGGGNGAALFPGPHIPGRLSI